MMRPVNTARTQVHASGERVAFLTLVTKYRAASYHLRLGNWARLLMMPLRQNHLNDILSRDRCSD